MVNKIKHPVYGRSFCCDICGFMYRKITHARSCENFCRKNCGFSLENVQKAIGRLEIASSA